MTYRGTKCAAQLRWCWMKSWGWNCSVLPGCWSWDLEWMANMCCCSRWQMTYASDRWFREYEKNAKESMVKLNLKCSEEDLMALAFRRKLHTNGWLYLSARLCALGEDAFEYAPAVIREVQNTWKPYSTKEIRLEARCCNWCRTWKLCLWISSKWMYWRRKRSMRDATQRWEEWEWDGRHPFFPRAFGEPPATDCELRERR